MLLAPCFVREAEIEIIERDRSGQCAEIDRVAEARGLALQSGQSLIDLQFLLRIPLDRTQRVGTLRFIATQNGGIEHPIAERLAREDRPALAAGWDQLAAFALVEIFADHLGVDEL